MTPQSFILLYEDFDWEPLSEDQEMKIKRLQRKKSNLEKRAMVNSTKADEAGQKSTKFKTKSTKTKDPIMKKIYSNRSNEERMLQQIYNARLRAVQMENRLNDTRLQTAELKKTRAEATKSG